MAFPHHTTPAPLPLAALHENLNDARFADELHERQNGAKFAALEYGYYDYERFKELVDGAHLRPLERNVRLEAIVKSPLMTDNNDNDDDDEQKNMTEMVNQMQYKDMYDVHAKQRELDAAQRSRDLLKSKPEPPKTPFDLTRDWNRLGKLDDAIERRLEYLVNDLPPGEQLGSVLSINLNDLLGSMLTTLSNALQKNNECIASEVSSLTLHSEARTWPVERIYSLVAGFSFLPRFKMCIDFLTAAEKQSAKLVLKHLYKLAPIEADTASILSLPESPKQEEFKPLDCDQHTTSAISNMAQRSSCPPIKKVNPYDMMLPGWKLVHSGSKLCNFGSSSASLSSSVKHRSATKSVKIPTFCKTSVANLFPVYHVES